METLITTSKEGQVITVDDNVIRVDGHSIGSHLRLYAGSWIADIAIDVGEPPYYYCCDGKYSVYLTRAEGELAISLIASYDADEALEELREEALDTADTE